ncbi:MAG: hypothetical protein OEZ65_15890 [Gemmatimonadota bacterium]|nr:hypothetical protein [Gemmatimonadota bacterium]
MTVLDLTSALGGLVEIWENDAESQRRYDPEDPKAKTLQKCVSDLRRILGTATPEWVPIRTVHAATGQSLPHLRKLCEDLEPQGRARKRGSGRSSRWEMTLDAALEVPARRERIDTSSAENLDDLAKILGRDPG